jgi:exodeoxyribonuclease-3
MWASPQVARQAKAHSVLEDARDWSQPSDHVPLIMEFDL